MERDSPISFIGLGGAHDMCDQHPHGSVVGSGQRQPVAVALVDPDHRRRGYAGRLLRHAIQAARDQGRAGVVLTCKERLLPYYAKFGFVSEGVSASVHGGAVWYQMRLAF